MESINSEYTCNKCNKKININNKFLHDNNCKMFYQQDENLDRLCYMDYIENRRDLNDNNINMGSKLFEYPSLGEISNFNTDKKINDDIENKLHKSGEYKICKKCDTFLFRNEYEDHVICHNLQDDGKNLDKKNERHDFTFNKNEIKDRKLIGQLANSDDLFNDCDMIEDKDQLLKEIEEDEIFMRKFKDKKDLISKSKNGIIKNTFSYLFDLKFRRVPPIVRIIGAVFDRRQFLRLAEDEIAARIATRLIEGPQTDEKEDEQILLSLIPEIKLTDIDVQPPEKRDCVICGDSYEKNHKVSNLPCLHTFHSHCIKEWFKQKNICPICKYELTKENFK